MKSITVFTTKSIEVSRNSVLLAGSVVFAILITIGAFVYVPLPFTPVPLTLQILFVLLCGIILGGRYGTFSAFLYVSAGVMGIPVFAGAYGGLSRILGPTGGYIIGFLVAPSVVSFLFRIMGKKTISAFGAMLGGLFIIYCAGVLHLALFFNNSFLNAVKIGIIPFVIGDVFKIFLASILVHTTRRRLWNV